MDMMANAQCIKKYRPRVTAIDVHPTEKALVLKYVNEAVVFGANDTPMVAELKECQKVIRVKNLSDKTDLKALATKIVSQTKVIEQTHLLEVEQLLYYLLTRKVDVVPTQAPPQNGNQLKELIFTNKSEIDEKANLYDVDDYIELLYEDIPQKIRGTALILQLARNPDYIEELCNNEILLGALSRVLRDDSKRNTDLVINIVFVFYCFSVYSRFHPFIIHFKVGSLCMSIIEHELKKYDNWVEEMGVKRKQMGEAAKNATARKKYEKSEMKFKELVMKQEVLLRVSFFLLLNLAEDVNVEQKMRSKKIIQLLLKTLERDDHELLIIVVSFLKKLSIFIENKNEMAESNIIEKLAKLVPCENEELLHVTLKLLLNLSLDRALRITMIKVGLLPKLAELLRNENHYMIVLWILLHISLDDKARSLFAFTECVPMVMCSLLESRHERPGFELVALCISLASNRRCAQIMCENKGLRFLMKKAFTLKDPLVMLMIRHLAMHRATQMQFVKYIANFAEVVASEDQHVDFKLEAARALGDLTIPELDYDLLLKEYKLLPWIKGVLLHGISDSEQDPFLLAVVVLIGKVCQDDMCAKFIAEEGFIEILINLLKAQQEDDEIVLQIVYVFYQMIFHEATRGVILTTTHAPAFLIDLMHDKNRDIQSICDGTLDAIAEYDAGWAKLIRERKFEWHNSQWLEMIGTYDIEDEENAYDPFLIQDSNTLHDPNMFYGDDNANMFYGDDNPNMFYANDSLEDPFDTAFMFAGGQKSSYQADMAGYQADTDTGYYAAAAPNPAHPLDTQTSNGRLDRVNLVDLEQI